MAPPPAPPAHTPSATLGLTRQEAKLAGLAAAGVVVVAALGLVAARRRRASQAPPPPPLAALPVSDHNEAARLVHVLVRRAVEM